MVFHVNLCLYEITVQDRERLNPSELANILAEHIHRCQQLQIIWDVYDDFCQFAEGVSHLRAPVLQSIHICREDERVPQSIPEDAPFMRVFEGGAPSLQSLKTRGIQLGVFLPPLESVSLVELHRYDLSDIGSWTNFKDILGGLPFLKHLIINGDIISSWPSDSNTIPLLALTNLRVRASSDGTSSHFPRFLNAILCPLLEDLFVEMVIISEMNEYLQLTSRIPKFPLLRSLTFFPPLSQHLDEPLWAYMAIAFPTITHITYCISRCNQFISFVEGHLSMSLFPDEFRWPDALPWPNLQIITLINRYRFPTSPLEQLQQMMSTRANSNHPLRKVQLPQEMLNNIVPSDSVTVEASSLYNHLNEDNYDIEWMLDEN